MARKRPLPYPRGKFGSATQPCRLATIWPATWPALLKKNFNTARGIVKKLHLEITYFVGHLAGLFGPHVFLIFFLSIFDLLDCVLFVFAGVFIVTFLQNVLHIPRKYGNDNGRMQPIFASSIGFLSTMIVFYYNPHLI